jgi:hypothetical protein
MTLAKCFLLCWFGSVVALAEPVKAGDDLDAGPLFDRFSLTLDPGWRTEAVGPFYYQQQADSERLLAVPPLFFDARDTSVDSEQFSIAYPLLTYNRYGAEYRWQLFQLLSLAGGQDQNETGMTRFTLFPLYFQQRSPDPEQNYTALFPLYGHLKDRLFRDDIRFILFPFYGQSRKRDVVTDNYVYPIFHLRRGEALHGWQFWPLAGHEHKDMTTRTNGFGDTEVIGGHDKQFVLWPLSFDEATGIGTDNPQKLHAVFPAYSVLRSPKRDATTVLWPFFTSIDDREKKYHEWEGPWPFVIMTRGEGKTTTRVWPFFSRAHDASLESDFYLWPAYKYNRLHVDGLERERTRIFFFLYSDVAEQNTQTGTARHRTDFWPLFSHRRDYSGNTRLQILALVEPFFPNNSGIQRNYSPLWSVWRSENNPKTGAASQSLLWNLYRRDTTATARKGSLLFGLFQYQSDSESKRMRIFYIPFGKTRNPADAGNK